MTHVDTTPVLESWRVITVSGPGPAPVCEATVRITAGPHRVVVNGEGTGVAAALEAGVASAVGTLDRMGVQVTDAARGRLEDQLRPCATVRTTRDEGALVVRAIHGNAVVTRLASALGNHDVTRFEYAVSDDGVAHVAVVVSGGDRKVERAAHLLRRVVGVLDVTRG